MECREACGACCIAPSIKTPYYGMPKGKAAGTPCVHLAPDTMRCVIWGSEHYPEVCRGFAPTIDACGTTRTEAIKILSLLERDTAPDSD